MAGMIGLPNYAKVPVRVSDVTWYEDAALIAIADWWGHVKA